MFDCEFQGPVILPDLRDWKCFGVVRIFSGTRRIFCFAQLRLSNDFTEPLVGLLPFRAVTGQVGFEIK